MNDAGKPFYAQVISMSAHHPFTIPAEKHKLKLPERYEGTFVGDYVRSQNYADYAFGQFVDELKADGLWEDSLIMVYGDHMGLPIYSLDNDDKELMKEIYGHEYSYADMLNIPLLIHGEGLAPQKLEQVGGEVDIMPTAASLLGGIDGSQPAFRPGSAQPVLQSAAAALLSAYRIVHFQLRPADSGEQLRG
ncbi:LTA synthase family protein [Paenibacillus rhizoplanae]